MKKILILTALALNTYGLDPFDNEFVKMGEGTIDVNKPQDTSNVDDQFPSSRVGQDGLAKLDDGKVVEIKQDDGSRERQAYVSRPMTEIRGIAESTELVELIKLMSNTKLSETMIALGQTEPSLSDAVQHTNQITAEYLDAINTGDIRFRRLMEQYPGLADKYLPAYEGCIAKQMELGESWTTAVLKCSGDAPTGQGEGQQPRELTFAQDGDMFDLTKSPDATGGGVTATEIDVVESVFSKIKITGTDVAKLKTNFKELFGNVKIKQGEFGASGAFTVTTTREKPSDTALKEFTTQMEDKILEKTLEVLKIYCQKKKAAVTGDADKKDFLGETLTNKEDRYLISVPGAEIDNKLVSDMYQFIGFQHKAELEKNNCDIDLFKIDTFKKEPSDATFKKYSRQIGMVKAYVSFVVASKLSLTFQKALQVIDMMPELDAYGEGNSTDIIKNEARGMIIEVAGQADFTTNLNQNLENFRVFIIKLNEINAKNSGKGDKKGSGAER